MSAVKDLFWLDDPDTRGGGGSSTNSSFITPTQSLQPSALAKGSGRSINLARDGGGKWEYLEETHKIMG